MYKSDLIFLLQRMPIDPKLSERITKAVMRTFTKAELVAILDALIEEHSRTILAAIVADPDRLESLQLSIKTENVLLHGDVNSVTKLLDSSESTLRKLLFFDNEMLREIEVALSRRGQRLSE